jgi:hypothetical protein
LVLYACGDDEATVERVFPRPAGTAATPGAWLQGILVVSPKIWFNFLPSAAGNFANHVERFRVMSAFHLTLFDAKMKVKQRFLIEGAPGLRLPRIALLFQPRMEFGPVPQPLSGFKPPNATENNADVVIDVVFHADGAPPSPAVVPHGPLPSTKPRVRLNAADASKLSVLRFALNLPAPNNAAITVADLEQLAGAVTTMLGGPRTVRDLPT